MGTVATARPDRNAFINKKVDTTAELVAQVKRDPHVMDRYMRHYGMTRSEVIEFLSSLRPETLKEEGVYAIYSVPEGGKLKMHLEKMKKGHKVFASKDGVPQLVLLCGNPLSLGPKQVVALNGSPIAMDPTTSPEEPAEIVAELNPEFEPVAAVVPAEPVYVFAPTTAPPIPILGGGGGFNPLPLLVGGLGFIGGGGGGGEPVPEPMTMAVFGAGLAYLGVRKRRQSTK